MTRNKIATSLRYAISCFLILFASRSLALNNVLEQIDVREGRDQSTIKVIFNERLVYRSHAPKRKSDVLQVELNAVGLSGDVTFENEFLSWKPGDSVPLFEAGLEWLNTAQASLILRFRKQVEYEVQTSSDSYSIIITLFHPQSRGKPTAQLEPTSDIDKIVPVTSFKETAENKLLAKIMEDARQAIAKKDYSTAVRLYTKVLGSSEKAFAKQALEYLGVAREKKGQLAHAKAIYEKYLKRYRKGEDAERVRQRLLAMISIGESPRQKLRAGKKKFKIEPEWELYGSFSQFYNRDVSSNEITGSTTNQSSVRSDLDITSRRRSEFYDLTARFTGGHTADLLSKGPGDEKRISSFYVDVRDKVRGASVRLGRQSRTSGGVLGRFDGLFSDYQLTEKIKLNFVAGYPVDSSRDVNISSERYFFGLSADIGTFSNAWDINLFAINQKNDGITDRRAVGGEVRFFQPDKSFFTLVDYDIFYQSLNIFLFTGQWNISSDTNIHVSYDYRNSPLLTTRNAIQGQAVSSISALLNIFPESTINDLAEDRTAISKTLFAGVSHQLNKMFQLNGDIRLSRLSDTKASGGVAAAEGTDTEIEYSLQLTGFNLLKEGDLALVTLTFADLTTSEVTTLTLNTRYPITRALRVNPKFRIRHKNNHNDGSSQWVYSPSVQLTYRLRRYFQLEGELGGEWSNTELSGDTDRTKSYFLFVGYRLDF